MIKIFYAYFQEGFINFSLLVIFNLTVAQFYDVVPECQCRIIVKEKHFNENRFLNSHNQEEIINFFTYIFKNDA